MKKRVGIIGGGASGMMAAIFAAKQGAEVLLLEHTKYLGKKILATGNGKCNLSNERMEAECYHSDVPDFPMKVLKEFGLKETIHFFEELGIVIKSRDGYLYPYSGQAASVAEVLRQKLKSLGVQVQTECQITEIKKEGKKYRIFNQGKVIETDAVILACGSKASPSTGSDGSGYDLVKKFGISVIEPLPALVQLKCKEKFYKQIAGVRMDARVRLLVNGEETASDLGEVQFTDYGISGIPVFQVSRFAAKALWKKKKVTAVLDLYPLMSYRQTIRFLTERKEREADKKAEDYLTGWFNSKMGELLLKESGIDKKRLVRTLKEQEIVCLAKNIKEFKTEITGTNPFANAQICCGGADVRSVNPKTMEVKSKKGLYLAGELLDVDGICGGYNLQWAWSTGAVAGTHAGKKYDSD